VSLLTELYDSYLDRLLRIRQYTPDDVEAKTAMVEVVEGISIDITHAKVVGNVEAAEAYTSLRAILREEV
jgi:hypothetical protein